MDMPAEHSPESVRTLPAVGGRRDTRTLPIAGGAGAPRLLGLPTPAWIIAAGLAVVLIIGAVVILPRLGRPAAVDQAGGDGVGEFGTGDPAPSVGASAATSVNAAVPGLELGTVVVVDEGLLGLPLGQSWRVSVTIVNPAGVDQRWRSVSVAVTGAFSHAVGSATEGVRVYDAGQVVCAEPTNMQAATVGSSGEKTIELRVSSRDEPHKVRLDDDACAARD